MILNKLFRTSLLMILYIGGYAQESTISAIVDGKKTHEKVITDTPSILTIQRAKFKNVHSLVLVCRLPVNKVYKRSVDFTDQNELTVYHIQESKLKPVNPDCKVCSGTGFVFNPSKSQSEVCPCRIIK